MSTGEVPTRGATEERVVEMPFDAYTDPVRYLGDLGLEAELVETCRTDLDEAA